MQCCVSPHLLAAETHDGERRLDERHKADVLWVAHLAQLQCMLLHHAAGEQKDTMRKGRSQFGGTFSIARLSSRSRRSQEVILLNEAKPHAGIAVR